jgi:xylulokinase
VAGGARSKLWLQIKADVTGKLVSVPHELETTALGAAMLAGVAGGLFTNLQEAVQAAVSVAMYTEPRSEHRQAYDDAYVLYREVYDALQEPFRKAAAQ